jgi:phasin family protein
MADDTNNDGNKSEADRMRDGFAEHVTGPAMRAGETMRQTGQKMAEGGSTISTKLIDQAETNARQAFAAMRAAAAAKDPTEMMKIQGDYLREQSNRAMAQAREISELIVQFGKDTAGALKPGGE